MPASYVHQCVASDALAKLKVIPDKLLTEAVLAGSEGPDPLFFTLHTKKGQQAPPEVGHLLHKERTGAFLKALITGAGQNSVLQSFVYGFLAHYATDTVCHPYVYSKSFNSDGSYNGNKHCKFEHVLEVLLYRTQGHNTGLPLQMGGYKGLSKSEKKQIAGLFASAINATFPEHKLTEKAVFKSFKDSILNCDLLRFFGKKKHSLVLSIVSKTPAAGLIDSHSIPNIPLSAMEEGKPFSISGFTWETLANREKLEWRSYWEPDKPRNESFSELYDSATERSVSFITAAVRFFDKQCEIDDVMAIIGDMCYDSGIAWEKTARLE